MYGGQIVCGVGPQGPVGSVRELGGSSFPFKAMKVSSRVVVLFSLAALNAERDLRRLASRRRSYWPVVSGLARNLPDEEELREGSRDTDDRTRRCVE